MNSVTAMLVPALVVGLAGTFIGYSVGYHRGHQDGVHYLTELRDGPVIRAIQDRAAAAATAPAED